MSDPWDEQARGFTTEQTAGRNQARESGIRNSVKGLPPWDNTVWIMSGDVIFLIELLDACRAERDALEVRVRWLEAVAEVARNYQITGEGRYAIDKALAALDEAESEADLAAGRSRTFASAADAVTYLADEMEAEDE